MLKSFLCSIIMIMFALPAFALQDIPKMSDDEFVDMVERDTARLFYESVDPKSGLLRNTWNQTSVASVGFQLNALCIASERGWLPREEAADLTLKILDTFLNKARHHKGAFLWITDSETATKSVFFNNNDIVETAFVCAGALTAKQYFDRGSGTEKKIREYADKIYRRVDFAEYQKDTEGVKRDTLAWHYNNDVKKFGTYSGSDTFRVDGYNETMFVCLLAMGSPTQPASPEVYDGWHRNCRWETRYGYSYFFCPSLFTHQYTQSWFDLRGLQDKYVKEKNTTYFENSRRATLSHIAYAKENPFGFPGYGPIWGLSDCACPLPPGHAGHGIQPSSGYTDDGTISVPAAGASMVYTPKESIAFLRHIYSLYGDKIYTKWGFKGSFNVNSGWIDWQYDYLNQGAMLTGIENYRTGLIWKLFMKNPEARKALKVAGFKNGEIVAEKQPAKFEFETVDKMSSADGWFTVVDKDSDMKLYDSTDGVKADYDLGNGRWVVMIKKDKTDLSSYKGLRVIFETDDLRNTVELKLVDGDGSMFGTHIFQSLKKGSSEAVAPFSNFTHWLGGDEKLDLSTAQIQIAVSRNGDASAKPAALKIMDISAYSEKY